VADTPSRQVVLIVEDEALVRMTAVDMIEEAGFEILEATNADEAILLLEARLDITVVFTDIEMPGSMNGLRLAEAAGADGRPLKSSRHRATTSCVTATCRLAGYSWQNLTALIRFPAHYGRSRPGPDTDRYRTDNSALPIEGRMDKNCPICFGMRGSARTISIGHGPKARLLWGRGSKLGRLSGFNATP
jgi:CheY-like chemotaxis protein